MTKIAGLCFILLVDACPVFSQFEPPAHALSRLALGTTSEVLPASTFGFQVSTPVFGSQSDPYHLTGITGIGGVAEVELSDAGFVRNLMGEDEHQPSVGLKFRVFSSEGERSVVALVLQKTLLWNSDQFYWYEVQSRRPDLFARGLGNASYEYQYATASCVVTRRLNDGILLSGRLGVQDLMYRNFILTGFAPDLTFPILAKVDKTLHNIGLDGSVSLLVPFRGGVCSMLEIGQMPAFKSNGNIHYLTFDTEPWGLLGVRYDFATYYSVDAVYRLATSNTGKAEQEFRMGLNLFVTLR